MTPKENEQAQPDAEKDAKEFGLLLLYLFTNSRGVKTVSGNRFEFDQTRLTFRIDGRKVSITSIRKYLQTLEDKYAKRLAKLTNQLEAGQITLADWQGEFERTISASHILAGVLVLGSIAASFEHTFVGAQISEQKEFLKGFAGEIRVNKAGSFARIRSRAKSYTRSLNLTFGNLELKARIGLGDSIEAKRLLRALESCHTSAATPGCLELAAKGWVPIAETVPLGKATCGPYCRCYIVYR